MQQLDDHELIGEILSGSDAAFAVLMQRYERLVFTVSYSFTRNREDALDLTQEVFVRAYEKLESYSGRGSFKGWLLRLAQNVNLSWIRSRRRDKDHKEFTPDDLPPLAARQESDLIRREERAMIFENIEKLNPRQTMVVTLRYFECMRLREIAEALECSEGSVKSILFRSLEKLRRQMASQWSVSHERMP